MSMQYAHRVDLSLRVYCQLHHNKLNYEYCKNSSTAFLCAQNEMTATFPYQKFLIEHILFEKLRLNGNDPNSFILANTFFFLTKIMKMMSDKQRSRAHVLRYIWENSNHRASVMINYRLFDLSPIVYYRPCYMV